MNASGSEHRGRSWLPLAVAWVGLFTVVFFAVVPSGASASRATVWSIVPFQLLDVLDPPAEPDLPAAGWHFLPQRIDLVAVAAFLLLGSRALGSWLLRVPVLPRFDTRLEREVFAWGLGLSAWSLVVLAFGIVGWLSGWLFVGLLGIAIVSDVVFARRHREFVEGEANESSVPDADEPVPRWVWIVAVPFLALFVLGAALPPTEYDAKGYHLLGPKEFFLVGRIEFLPHNVYTSFPFLTEMLTLSGMVVRGDWFRGALIGRLVLAAFGPLTALVLFVTARRWFGARAGWLAGIVYLTLPWTAMLSTTSYVEGAFACYLALTLLATLRTTDFACAEVPTGWALLAGLMAGSAMACKYPALLLVVVPAGIAVAVAATFRVRSTHDETASSRGQEEASHGSRSKAFSTVAAYAAGVAITVGPWLLKNVAETGNPVFPLAYGLFGGGDWTSKLAGRWSRAHSPDDHDPTGIPGHVLELTLRNTRLSPLLYGFAPLALLAIRRKSECGWSRAVLVLGTCGYLVWFFVVWWAFTHRIDRFWVPMLPVVALLAGIGASRFDQRSWRTGVAVLVGLSATFSLALVTLQVTSGQAGFHSYLADLDAARRAAERTTAPAVFAANEALPADAVVLCVGEAQVFDARFRPIYHTVFNASQFERWCAVPEANTPASEWRLRPTSGIREEMDAHGVTHVLVNWAEIARYSAPGSYGFSPFVTPDRIDELVERGLLRPMEPGPLVVNPLPLENGRASRELYEVVP